MKNDVSRSQLHKKSTDWNFDRRMEEVQPNFLGKVILRIIIFYNFFDFFTFFTRPEKQKRQFLIDLSSSTRSFSLEFLMQKVKLLDFENYEFQKRDH